MMTMDDRCDMCGRPEETERELYLDAKLKQATVRYDKAMARIEELVDDREAIIMEWKTTETLLRDAIKDLEAEIKRRVEHSSTLSIALERLTRENARLRMKIVNPGGK